MDDSKQQGSDVNQNQENENVTSSGSTPDDNMNMNMNASNNENNNVRKDDNAEKQAPRNFENYNFNPMLEPAPVDSEGFVQSFDIDDVENYIKFYEKYGFVIVRNVLSTEEVQATIDDIWDQITKQGSGKISRDDPSTWVNANWPQIQRMGIIGTGLPLITPQAWRNRQNEKVYRVFSTVLENNQLWVTFDRYGCLRPTAENPEYRTVKDWLHWDMNPWTYEVACFGFDRIVGNKGIYGPRKVQGLISMTDTREEDGGFTTVPGFHKYFFEWAKANEEYFKSKPNLHHADFVPVPKDDPHLYKHVQKITMRAGSLIIWDRKQAHANFPNNSKNFRMCQYLTFIAADPLYTRQYPADVCLDKFQPSELGAKIFGLKEWQEQSNTNSGSKCVVM